MTNHFVVDGKTVVISGASQGLGLALAKKLVPKGANLILLARSTDRLKKIKAELTEQCRENQFVDYFTIDLTKYDEVLKLNEYFVKLDLKPDILFCCVGSSLPKLFTELTVEDLDSGIDINYKSCVYLIHSLSKLMLSEKITSNLNRHIVILSSSVSFYSFIGYSQYAPLKSALKSLGDSIRQEFKPFGVKVSTVFPGNFNSEGYVEENLTKPSITKTIEGSSVPISVESCSELIIKQLQSGTTYIHTDFIGWVLNCFSLGFGPRNYWFIQVIFGLFGNLFARLVDIYHESLILNYFKEKEGGVEDENKKDRKDI